MKREAPYNIQRIKKELLFFMDRRILFILIMSLAVPYGCSMALLGTSLAKPGGLKEQEALSAAWASDSRKTVFRRIRMDMEDPPEKR